MKKQFHHIFSVTMAFLVLLSTLSMTVESRYCGTTLVDRAVFSEIDKCCVLDLEIEQENIKKVKCCYDVIDVIEGNELISTTSFEDLETAHQLVFKAYVFDYSCQFEVFPKQIIPIPHYKAPPLIFNIQALDCQFLI